MLLKIQNTTTFTYDQPVSEAYTEMRLKPLDAGGQRCLFFNLVTEPQDAVLKYTDHFGNDVHHFDVIQSHQKMVVAAISEVLTADRNRAQLREVDAAIASYDQGIAALAAAEQLHLQTVTGANDVFSRDRYVGRRRESRRHA